MIRDHRAARPALAAARWGRDLLFSARRRAEKSRPAADRAALALRALPQRLLPRSRSGLSTLPVIESASPRSAPLIAFVAGAGDSVDPNARFVCLLPPTSEPVDAAGFARLADAIDGDTVATTATVVHPRRGLLDATPHDERVRAAGLLVALVRGAPVAIARHAGERLSGGPPVEVAGSTGAVLLVERGAYDRAGGLRPTSDLDLAAFDLCTRLRASGGSIVCVPDCVVVDHRPVRSARELKHALDPRGAAWCSVVEDHGAFLRRSVGRPDPARLVFAITVAAPSAKIAKRWGDWHLASDLARALERLGHQATVHTLDLANSLAVRSADVHVVLRGLEPVLRTPGQRHVLWIISHPELVRIEECDEADLVLVASNRFAAHLRARSRTPVEVFLQATDTGRFRPTSGPRGREVAVVGKTRGVARPIVTDALTAGLRPAIYGTGWEQFVDRDLIVRDYVPNDELPALYASVAVLLNDHWETMREWGFVSNRVFDALACGTPVVSDELPELEELFGDAVLVYRDPAELRKHVESVLNTPKEAQRRADRGRASVLRSHTFDRRAATLLELLARHRSEPLETGAAEA